MHSGRRPWTQRSCRSIGLRENNGRHDLADAPWRIASRKNEAYATRTSHPLPGPWRNRSQSAKEVRVRFDSAPATAYLPGPVTQHSGAVAHLGERLHGMQEVEGSIPFGSTGIPL